MKVYVTKYALTSGVLAYELVKDSGNMAVVKNAGSIDGQDYFHGTDWHYEKSSAIARAEEMRTAKLASIAKQKAKLEAMTFTIPEE